MIEHTFQILPSVGAKKERSIWESGILDWDDFLSSDNIGCVKPALKEKSDPIIMQAAELLKEENACALSDLVPKSEHWRMYDRFKDDAAYLDIETDGLSRDALVTVVTVHRKDKTYTLTEGFDLDSESLSDALKGSKMLVTFNGSCFDVPVLRNSFPEVDFDIPQYDLRFASRKVGFKGGLKPLEIELGITRAEEIEGVDGAEAVHLWHMWKRHGDEDALNILQEYNRADTINLEYIAGVIYGKLVREHAGYKW
ncbi:ribonuclease H-like domain-containing protein [Methanomassiliicoccales archaeon LGM-RCC1]|nr:ribonuclease H-like domain-containing protein [Methanomassiliicoccales archaeon LGM-RCC1]